MYKKHGKKIEAGALSDKQSDSLALGQWPHLVKGWNGITEDGEPLEYSPQVVMDLAANPQYSTLFTKIERIAKDEENFRISVINELGKS